MPAVLVDVKVIEMIVVELRVADRRLAAVPGQPRARRETFIQADKNFVTESPFDVEVIGSSAREPRRY